MTPTPGPWIVKRDSGLRQRIQTAGDKGTLCYMTARPFAHGANFSHEQITANAHLIAAAPDLLNGLMHLVRLLEPLEHSGALNVPGLATLNGARAAIAKAQGES